MPEAKQLTHMAVTAMLGAMLLGAVVALITLGYNIWGAFSKQEAVNKRVSDYAKYAAFDNTDVRGQDVISLITQTQGELLVFVVGPSSSATNVDNYKNSAFDLVGLFVNDISLNSDINDANGKLALVPEGTTALGENVTGGQGDGTSVADLTHVNNLSTLFSTSSTSNVPFRINYSSSDIHFGKKPLQEIQAEFLSRAAIWKIIDPASAASHSDREYIMYRSNLIYDPATSSEIIGVMFTEKGFT